MPRPYRVGIIGRTGRGDYGHALDQAWLHVGDAAAIVAVADDDDAGRQQAAERLGGPRQYADWRQMLDREKPQIVTVAQRWADQHCEMILACADIGAHVFVEKPLCSTLRQADELVAACARAGIRVAVAQHLRYLPQALRALEMIKAGDLGEVIELRGSCKEDRRGGGEDFALLGSHLLDFTRLALGEPGWCFARVLEEGKPITRESARPGNEGIGPIAGDRIDAMYYGFAGPPIAYVASRRDDGSPRFGLRVFGTKGAVAIEPGQPQRVSFTDDPRWGRDRPWQPVTVEPDEVALRLPEVHWIQQANVRIARDLMRAIETGTPPRCSIEDARAILEMVQAVYESQLAHAPAALPLPQREHPLIR